MSNKNIEETYKYKDGNKKKFPSWLLLLLIIIICAVALWFILGLKKNDKGQSTFSYF
jgi:hypothetical protein